MRWLFSTCKVTTLLHWMRCVVKNSFSDEVGVEVVNSSCSLKYIYIKEYQAFKVCSSLPVWKALNEFSSRSHHLRCPNLL